jgi:uncharacterized membrane protein
MGPPNDILASFLWNIGFSLCHQIPERSFFINDWQLPFCARDTGTFLGFLVVISFFLVQRRYRRVMLPDKAILALSVAGLAFYAFDGTSSYLGFRSTANDLRLLSGLAFGSGMTFLFASVSSTLFFRGNEKRPVFEYRDILAIYPIMGIVCLPLFVDMGAPFYYAMSILIVVGYLLMIFFLLGLVVSALSGWTLVGPGSAWKLTLLTMVLVSTFVVILWFGHALSKSALF